MHLEFNEVEQEIVYVNWRGETRSRKIIPLRLYWGSTEWHPENQWLVRAKDTESGAIKDFALSGFRPVEI